MWRSIIPAFENDYKLVLLDLMGSGNSDISLYSKERYSSLHGYAEDINGIISALELKDVIYVGHSVSSMIGMLAAIDKPDLFSDLVMIAPSPCYINKDGYAGGFNLWEMKGILADMSKGTQSWSDQYVPVILNTKDAADETAEMQASFCKTDPDILQQFAEVTFLSDYRADLAKLQVPSLILQCSDDLIAPEAVGTYMHQCMPLSKFKKLKATGHCPHLTAPGETIEVIMEYLFDSADTRFRNSAAGKKVF
jgi:sigma-B regulation protein RsbQ